MQKPDLTRWDLAYWTARLPHQKASVLAELSPGVLRDAEPVRVALEAAFEVRDWSLVEHIKGHWLDSIDPNEATNRASWPKREVLYHLRGKTEAKWLDLLLEARAAPADRHDQSLLCEATREIYSQVVDFREHDNLDRYFVVAKKLLDQGANPNDGLPSSVSLVSRMVDHLHAYAPERADDMQLLQMRMDEAIDMLAFFSSEREDMCEALRSEDFKSSAGFMKSFNNIPLPHRTWSPLEFCLSCFKNNSSYDIKEAISTLISAGMDVSSPDYSGQTPLYAVCDQEGLSSKIRNGLVSQLLAAGADPKIVNRQGFYHHPTAADTALHACSLLDNPPVEALARHGADLDVADIRGMAPLLYACREANFPMVRDLLRLGASPNCKTPEGKGAAHEFMENCARQMAEGSVTPGDMASACVLLHHAGLDFFARDEAGKSAWEGLFCSMDWNDCSDDLVEMLLSVESESVDLPWSYLLDVSAKTYSSGASLRALLQSKSLDGATAHASMGHRLRRM